MSYDDNNPLWGKIDPFVDAIHPLTKGRRVYVHLVGKGDIAVLVGAVPANRQVKIVIPAAVWAEGHDAAVAYFFLVWE